jgi:hypothetical protein
VYRRYPWRNCKRRRSLLPHSYVTVQEQAEVSSKIHFVHIASQLRGLKSPYLRSAMKTFEALQTRKKAKRRDCSAATDLRLFLRFSRSQRVKEREAPENLVTRLVTGNSVLGHTSYLFETGQKGDRSHPVTKGLAGPSFRVSWKSPRKGKSVRGSHPRLLVFGLTQPVYHRSARVF